MNCSIFNYFTRVKPVARAILMSEAWGLARQIAGETRRQSSRWAQSVQRDQKLARDQPPRSNNYACRTSQRARSLCRARVCRGRRGLMSGGANWGDQFRQVGPYTGGAISRLLAPFLPSRTPDRHGSFRGVKLPPLVPLFSPQVVGYPRRPAAGFRANPYRCKSVPCASSQRRARSKSGSSRRTRRKNRGEWLSSTRWATSCAAR